MAQAVVPSDIRAQPRLAGGGRRRGALFLGWCLISLATVAAVATSQGMLGPHDDTDLAYQRPGMLDLTTAPFHAPSSVVSAGKLTVVFFVRDRGDAAAITTAYAADDVLNREAQLRVVVASPAVVDGTSATPPLVADPDGRLAAAFHLRAPRDGGSPIGYALVDRHALVRYVTLDPELTKSLPEVQMLIEATK